jgi:hypothetical protein
MMGVADDRPQLLRGGFDAAAAARGRQGARA